MPATHFTAPRHRDAQAHPRHRGRAVARVGLGAFLTYAGISHLSFKRQEFQAQVPDWFPADKDAVVLASGVAEIAQGVALISGRRKKTVGRLAAAFFTAIFPGNIAQYTQRRSAFGLDTDTKRAVRLAFQPVLVGWALSSTRED